MTPAPQMGSQVVSADYETMIEEDAGVGISTDPNDFLIPMVYILQPLSPQVLRDNTEMFIEGAEPGHIYLKNSLSEPIQGDIWFQPCVHYRKWVEWVPRKQGGGFVASYDPAPPAPGVDPRKPPPILKAGEYRDPDNPKNLRWKINGSNDLVDTQYYVGNVVEEDGSNPREHIIALASTGHTFGKTLMTAARNRPALKSGMAPPLYLYMYHIITKMRSNQAGEWYVYDLPDPQDLDGSNVVRKVPQDLFVRGRTLAKAFGEGAIKADYTSQQDDGAGAAARSDGAM
jgi:hypothetical protein